MNTAKACSLIPEDAQLSKEKLAERSPGTELPNWSDLVSTAETGTYQRVKITFDFIQFWYQNSHCSLNYKSIYHLSVMQAKYFILKANQA